MIYTVLSATIVFTLYGANLNATNLQGKHDEEDTFPIVNEEELRNQYEGTTPAPQKYDSNHPDHYGTILIINIGKVRGAAERYGSEADVANLWNTFTSLWYRKPTYVGDIVEPLTRRMLLEGVRQFANAPLQKATSATVVAIMSHADEDDKIITSDCDRVTLEEVKNELSDSKFLTGKPKLLIVLSCRGGDRDIIQDICHESNSAVDRECQGNRCLRWPRFLRRHPTLVPEFVLAPKKADADFVTISSSQQGEASYRHVYLGSWFVTTLCSKVRKLYKNKDVMSLLEEVSRDVNSMSNSMSVTTTNTPQVVNSDDDRCTISSSLKKKFFLPYGPRMTWYKRRHMDLIQ